MPRLPLPGGIRHDLTSPRPASGYAAFAPPRHHTTMASTQSELQAFLGRALRNAGDFSESAASLSGPDLCKLLRAGFDYDKDEETLTLANYSKAFALYKSLKAEPAAREPRSLRRAPKKKAKVVESESEEEDDDEFETVPSRISWLPDEDERMRAAFKKYGEPEPIKGGFKNRPGYWQDVAAIVGTKNNTKCMEHWHKTQSRDWSQSMNDLEQKYEASKRQALAKRKNAIAAAAAVAKLAADDDEAAKRATAEVKASCPAAAVYRLSVGDRITMDGTPGVVVALPVSSWWKVRLDGERTVRKVQQAHFVAPAEAAASTSDMLGYYDRKDGIDPVIEAWRALFLKHRILRYPGSKKQSKDTYVIMVDACAEIGATMPDSLV